MLAVLFALLAALGYGASDYTAGIAARMASVLQVTIVSEAITVILVLLFVPWVSTQGPSWGSVAWATGAGVSGVCGALSLYLGFRYAAFNVASSLSAVGSAVFAVLAGILFGERPNEISLIGIGLALPAIVGVSATPGHRATSDDEDQRGRVGASTRRHLAGVAFGLVAGAGFGGLFVGLNRAGSGRDLWPLVLAPLAALIAVSCAGVVAKSFQRPTLSTFRLAAATGATNSLGVICFFFASHAGLLAVTAVITSLYPAGTIVLARVQLGERLAALQLAGLCLAAGAVALIAAGGAI